MWCLSGGGALAAATGISASPALEQITVGAGQQSASFDIHVTNNTAVAVALTATGQDFTALNTAGGVRFLSPRAGNPHGLASSIAFVNPQVAVAPGAEATISVVIGHTDRLAPGGHYGAVMLKAVSPGVPSSGIRVFTNEELSVLVFLTTAGQTTQQLNLAVPDQPPVQINWPGTADLVFTNTGNTQTMPRGVVTVSDMFHRVQARQIINIDSGIVLPGTARLYDVSLAANKVHWPGIYTLAISYRPDGSATTQTYTSRFVYVGTQVLFALGVGVAVAVVWAIYRSREVVGYHLRRRRGA